MDAMVAGHGAALKPARWVKRDATNAPASACNYSSPFTRGFAMDHEFSLPVLLSFVTLVAVLGIGIYHFVRNRGSQKKRGETPGGIAGPDPE